MKKVRVGTSALPMGFGERGGWFEGSSLILKTNKTL